jgi:hypothetical protein
VLKGGVSVAVWAQGPVERGWSGEGVAGMLSAQEWYLTRSGLSCAQVGARLPRSECAASGPAAAALVASGRGAGGEGGAVTAAALHAAHGLLAAALEGGRLLVARPPPVGQLAQALQVCSCAHERDRSREGHTPAGSRRCVS